MNLFRLALRSLWRDTRSGELTVLLLAIVIAVTSGSAISLFADRLQRTLTLQAAEFLAADLVLASSEPIQTAWLDQAKQSHLQQSQTVEFVSVLLENDEMLLAGIKAVSVGYPLRGTLKTFADNGETRQLQGPPAGEVWVEPRVLSALRLKIGDKLTVGVKPLTIRERISYEPDKRGELFGLSPRVMMNIDDLAATEIIAPGSRVQYFYQFAATPEAIAQFSQWLQPQLNPSQRLLDIHEARPEMSNALKRAERYLGLSSIVVVVIAGVAMAMASRRYSERHFDTAALLRCLGLRQGEVLRLFGYQFLMIGLSASALACGLGWLMQFALLAILQDLLPKQLAQVDVFALGFSFGTGLAILFGFALPPLLRLQHVAPLRVLRREMMPQTVSAWLVYGLALAVVTSLVWRYTADLKMTATVVGGGLLLTALLGGLLYGLLRQTRRYLSNLNLTARLATQSLLRTPYASSCQLLAFALTMAAMLLSFSVRNDLLSDWQQQLPDRAPNHFALNIFPNQQAEFAAFLQQQHIEAAQFYPVVRGRLTKINDVPVQQIVSKDSIGENAIQRDLSLTWSSNLPSDNVLVDGAWWQSNAPNQVSVEKKLADNLKIKVGDRLLFTIGHQTESATVTSLRQVRWETMKPNFYMMFTPGTLAAYPTTFLTSFYLPTAEKAKLNRLLKRYPSVTVLEVDALLQQFKTMLTQVTQAINLLLYFALAAGFMVLFSAVHSTLDERIYEGALLRTLGANRRLLRTAHGVEFALLGVLAAVVAVVVAELIGFGLYHWVLHLEYHAHPLRWLLTLTLGAGFVALAGFVGTAKIVQHAPMRIFRDN